MQRRQFLTRWLIGGGITAGAGAVALYRRHTAREELTSRLLEDALPTLAANASREIQTLPAQGREEIRRYFHGKCLNVHGFVRHISTDSFRSRLARCRSREEREQCLMAAFCTRVASEAEILNKVETVAETVGRELNDDWGSYCSTLASRWNERVEGYGASLSAENLSERLNRIVRGELQQAVRQVSGRDRAPALGQTVGDIGRSAVLLLPLVRFGKFGLLAGVPLFLVLAAGPIWNYILGQLADRSDEYQAAISSRLAMLGNRAGAEFEREVRRRLTDLHAWQEQSVRATAERLAQQHIGIF
jgi:hypothetical protein